jgi:polysaccharide export outer membrane protein
MTHPMVCSLVVGALLVSTTIPAEPADAQAPQDGAVEQSAGRSAAPEAYRIGPEDMLQISVWKNEAMTRTVPVRPDGKISLPLLNDVQAAGLTPLELRDALTQKLAEYIPQPEVSVIVAEVRSFKVSVMGEVARPARYELKSWTTVLDALALAGGFTQFAARSRIVILRPDGNSVRRIPFNYNKVIASEGLLDKIFSAGGDEQGNLYLQNGDIVLVP